MKILTLTLFSIWAAKAAAQSPRQQSLGDTAIAVPQGGATIVSPAAPLSDQFRAGISAQSSERTSRFQAKEGSPHKKSSSGSVYGQIPVGKLSKDSDSSGFFIQARGAQNNSQATIKNDENHVDFSLGGSLGYRDLTLGLLMNRRTISRSQGIDSDSELKGSATVNMIELGAGYQVSPLVRLAVSYKPQVLVEYDSQVAFVGKDADPASALAAASASQWAVLREEAYTAAVNARLADSPLSLLASFSSIRGTDETLRDGSRLRRDGRQIITIGSELDLDAYALRPRATFETMTSSKSSAQTLRAGLGMGSSLLGMERDLFQVDASIGYQGFRSEGDDKNETRVEGSIGIEASI